MEYPFAPTERNDTFTLTLLHDQDARAGIVSTTTDTPTESYSAQ